MSAHEMPIPGPQRPVAALEPRRRPFTAPSAPKSKPAVATRICAHCDSRRSVASFRRVAAGKYAEICRSCEKVADVDAVTQATKGRRMCIVCSIELATAKFNRKPNGHYSDVCLSCTNDPAVRITLEQERAAAIVLRALRQIAAARLDEALGCPALGVEGLRALAAEALRTIEAAR